MVCPAKTAFDLKKANPDIDLIIVPDAGHSAREIPTSELLRQAADKFKTL